MEDNVVAVEAADLVENVQRLADDGFRFVTMSCTEMGDKIDVLYHFDKDLTITNLRLTVDQYSELPSISKVYFGAVLAENEVQDFFNLTFKDLLVDYKGRFLIPEKVPTESELETVSVKEMSTPQVKVQIIDKKNNTVENIAQEEGEKR